MKIIKPSVEEFIPENPLQHIERCGRVCYKSEDKITDGSAEKFVAGIVKRGHLSVTEHFRYILKVDEECYKAVRMWHPKFLTMTNDWDYYISGSSRAFWDFYKSLPSGFAKCRVADCINTICAYFPKSICLFSDFMEYEPKAPYRLVQPCDLETLGEVLKHDWHTLKFICDRGVSHELVRHRPCSFSQESTRYCNYSGDKFGNELTFIEPCFWEKHNNLWDIWKNSCSVSESMYLYMIEHGATPQEARSVLPNSLKTELVITATNEEWLHLLKLRCSKAAHPQCREVCDMAREILKKSDPDIFGGI